MNRDELQDTYIKQLIDGMDHKDMYAFVYDTINDNLDTYSMKELIEEVEEYDPELLEDDLLANIGELEATAPDYGVGK